MTDQVMRAGAAPAAPARKRTTSIAALAACWVLAATYLQLIRGPGYRAPAVLWAEDGAVFLNQALRHSLWHNLFAPHAGYLQVIGRIVAQPAAHLPLSWAALWFAAVAAVVVSLISVLVWFASARVVRSRWARALLTALVPLLPQAGYEVNAAVNDLHWYLACAAFWVLLAAPTTLRGQLGAAAVVVLAALSDPLTALVLPAAVFGYLAVRRRIALLAPTAMVLALAVQGWVRWAHPDMYRVSPTVVGELPQIYALRVVLSAFTGDRMLGAVYPTWGMAVVVVAVLAFAAGFAGLLTRVPRRTGVLAVVTVLISIAYLVVPVGLRGTEGFLGRDGFGLGGSRYTIVPLLLLWAAVVVLLDAAVPAAPRTARPPVVWVALSCFLGAQLLGDWAAPSVRTGGPTWAEGLRTAAAGCALPPAQRAPQPVSPIGENHGAGSVPLVPGPDERTVAIAPLNPAGPPEFSVVVPCSAVRG
ncbi:glucosyltransferase [Saccharopolyspora cebuensis]|uniref:Glucosyltransferase n=1 Tax=Saccharopolyspora cebuensis TaxID=418759 RepID=A0ABV4CL54_9PSEU